jgi:uncharacterized protein YbaP (TraB family)
MMIKTLLRRALGAIGLAAMIAAPSAPATARSAQVRPALWEVSDADTTIYLFGTIHLLPKDYQWRTAKFDDAVARSQQLVVETIVDDKDPTKMLSAMTSLAFNTPNLPPLAQRVPPAKRAALAAAIKASGYPPQALDRMETWAAAFILLGNQFRDMGLKAGEGVEQTLRGAFTATGKTIGELESNRDQLGFFDMLPESAQRQLLEGAIDKPKDMSKDFDQMLGAWSRGDVKAIAATFNHDLASSPALRDVLLKRRNANWSHWVEQRMATPGAVMVAVGAGHLAGRDSLIEMLKIEGLKVHRLQ